MTRKIFTSGFMIMLMYVPLLAADSNACEQNINTLPWEIIAERINEKSWFCSKTISENDNKPACYLEVIEGLISERNYAFQVVEPVEFRLFREMDYNIFWMDSNIKLQRAVDGSWQDLHANYPIVAPERIVIGGIEQEGFFRVLINPNTKEADTNSLEFYAVISGNWKNDLFTFCRKIKDEIETNPDSQLIRSSIVVSHFDNVMELISEASFLSIEILEALKEAIKSKQDFEKGKCPDLVKGLNKIRLKRFLGADTEQFVVSVPESYNHQQPIGLLLHPDNRYRAAGQQYLDRSDLIDIWWHTVKDKDINWKSFQAFMEILKQKLNIDEDRIYISGWCGNGISAMSLAFKYPDKWAEVSIELGNSYPNLAGNALNLPVIYVKGHHQEEDLVAYYDFMVKCFQYFGCKSFLHSENLSGNKLRGSSIPMGIRQKSPSRILYAIEDLHNPRSYWIKIDSREDENFIATIDVRVEDKTIYINTENIDAYSIDLTKAPVNQSKPVEIIENGQSIGLVESQIFSRKSEKYKNAIYVKNEKIHGPIHDVFTDPYVVVWGTGGKDKNFCKCAEEIAKEIADGAPLYADTDMPVDLAKEYNLILVGTTETNLYLSKINEHLPIQFERNQICFDGNSYKGLNLGCILIYPNPINLGRYVVVFSANTSKGMKLMVDSYNQMNSIQKADVGIFEIDKDNQIKWHTIENFSTTWNWHNDWNEMLMFLRKGYPKWKWHQWVAKAIKKQLSADVVIVENPFKLSDSPPIGRITFRDLFNCFRNDWIVKIRLNGKCLKDLLMVAFGDGSARDIVMPVIEGVEFIKTNKNSDDKSISIDQIKNDKFYTVACSHRIINGKRMGMVLRDYEIVGDKYLILLLKDYICENRDLDIDKELNDLKFNVL